MNILHLSASYSFTDLYRNLLEELDQKSIKQTMYVALKSLNDANKRKLMDPLNTTYVFSAPFNRIDSYIYFTKINKIFKDLQKNVDLKTVDLLHAHFLFSDGGVAYKVKQKFNKDYIVAVRNTDLNVFFKYGFHVRHYGIKILEKAKKVIFLTNAYQKMLIDNYIPKKLQESIRKKSMIIPNGVDKFWITNKYIKKPEKKNSDEITFMFVGDLNENKNIKATLKVFEQLKQRDYNMRFHIIGKGPQEAEVRDWKLKTNNAKYIKLHGYVKDKKRLMKLYRSGDIFIMPSYKETFGLVYVEAMSQGLPIMFTKGQGIDGYFPEGHVGFSASPDNIHRMADNAEKIIKNYNIISKNALKESSNFDWHDIANIYINLYRKLILGKDEINGAT